MDDRVDDAVDDVAREAGDDAAFDGLRARYVGRGRPVVTLRVELSIAAALARAVGATDPVWFGDDSGSGDAAAGNAPTPVVPILPFTIPYLVAARSPAPAAGATDDLSELLGILAGDDGQVLHGEQAFVYRRTVVVGDVLTGGERIVELSRRQSNDGRRIDRVVSRTDWTDADGHLVVEATKTVLVVRAA